jgi:hypothetical protein
MESTLSRGLERRANGVIPRDEGSRQGLTEGYGTTRFLAAARNDTGAQRPPGKVFAYGAGVASISIPAISSAGMTSGSPLASTRVPKTTVSSSPAPRAVWTTSSS